MNDEPFVVALGARRWSLPHLPFRLIKSIQPALFKVYEEAGVSGAASLSEAQIDNLASAVWRAVCHVDPTLTLEDFLALPFSVADLLSALPAIAQAAGLRTQAAAAEASPNMGK